jgi:putative hemolysin
MNRTLSLAAPVAVALLTLAACAGPYGTEVPNIPAQATAALGVNDSGRSWCEDQGGELLPRMGRTPTCIFPNGAQCDPERVARGLCGIGVVGPAAGVTGRQ